IAASLASENDGRSDNTSQHCKGVLEAEDECQYNRHLVVESEKRGSELRLHEGQVWLEEERIVVIAEKAVSCGDTLQDVSRHGGSFLAQSLFRGDVGTNSIGIKGIH